MAVAATAMQRRDGESPQYMYADGGEALEREAPRVQSHDIVRLPDFPALVENFVHGCIRSQTLRCDLKTVVCDLKPVGFKLSFRCM